MRRAMRFVDRRDFVELLLLNESICCAWSVLVGLSTYGRRYIHMCLIRRLKQISPLLSTDVV